MPAYVTLPNNNIYPVMTPFEQLQSLTNRLNEINSQPSRTQNEVEKLRTEVNILNKVVVAILKTLPAEQYEKVKAIVNGTDKGTS